MVRAHNCARIPAHSTWWRRKVYYPEQRGE